MAVPHYRKHIVVVGGGFAGLAAALEVEKLRQPHDHYNVTLIDRQSYHTYHALLYEVATAKEMLSLEQRAAIEAGVTVRLKSLEHLTLKKAINIVQGNVTRIDREHQRIELEDQPAIDYDYLVLALGSVSNDFGIPGLADHSLALKELPDALAIHTRLHQLLGHCERTKAPVRMIIGGAGISGIETAGELKHYAIQRCGAKGHDHRLVEVILLEAAPTVLPGFPEWVQRAVVQRLSKLGIHVKTGMPVVKVDDHAIVLKDGSTVPYDLLVWSGGIKAHPLMGQLGTTCAGNKQQVCVDEFLRLPNDPNVSVVGDAVFFVDDQTKRPVPQTAPIALEQGRLAAVNIVRATRGEAPVRYQPSHNGFVFPVGGRWAISTLWGMKLTGWLAWVLRKIVDYHYFLGVLTWWEATKVWLKGGRVYLQND